MISGCGINMASAAAERVAEKKRQLVSGLKPLIQKMVTLIKSLEECVLKSGQTGKLDIPGAVGAMKLVVPLQQELITLVDSTCGDLGSFGTQMQGFAYYEFKGNETVVGVNIALRESCAICHYCAVICSL